jgi:hypothetical protein
MRGLAFLDTYRTISLNKLRLTQRLETMARLRRPYGRPNHLCPERQSMTNKLLERLRVEKRIAATERRPP